MTTHLTAEWTGRPTVEMAGGLIDSATSLPPFVRHPHDGIIRRQLRWPPEVAPLAARHQVEPGAVLLAAHLRVVGLLASTNEVTAVLADETDRTRQLLTADLGGSWGDLVTASGTDPSIGAVLEIRHPGLLVQIESKTITVHADPALWDGDRANSYLEYLTGALTAWAADPDRPATEADLITATDRELLVNRLGRGADVELPDRPFAELFTERALADPDRIALIHRDRRFSYGWLTDAVDRVVAGLTRSGVAAGDVVAVALPRSPHWIAAVIGVLRHGAVYLPLEAAGPSARQQSLVVRSGATVTVDAALIGQWITTNDESDAVIGAGPTAPADRPEQPVTVRPGWMDPAYVYYTSGSTGLPKGAVCGHLGMLNHLQAKIDDCGMTTDDIVLQSTQATFDISLWQFAAPLMIGATVVILDHQDLLDLPTFLRTIRRHSVTVVQVVPSYLDVLLLHLESGGDATALASVRCLPVTGEAISKQLVDRFFRALPNTTLINCYGATEASDDTNHEIMAAPPGGRSVPIGRPLGNVTVHVLDPADRLVPPGSIGEIVFSGMCVGLGYLGEPERTAAAFGDDPIRPGERLYRSGDFGRWLPGGNLEFHGRRDEQVKISGIRLELGEIEYQLLQLPGVTGAAVVTVPSSTATKQLAGFYTAAVELDGAAMASTLAGQLPTGAVPTTLTWLPQFPLNSNGKVDKHGLSALARDHLGNIGNEPPITSAEIVSLDPELQRIAEAWSSALDVPVDRIRPEDNFFVLGGTSMRALRAVAALDGFITIDDLIRHPILAELAGSTRSGGAAAPTDGLLRRLSGPAGTDAVDEVRVAVIYFPPAAGSALSAQPLAAAISAGHPAVTVYAVQAPGHDLSTDEPPVPQREVVDSLVAELDRIDAQVILWGHCSGAAAALELARLRPDRVRHLLLGGQPSRTSAALRKDLAVMLGSSDDELAADLAGLEGVDLTELPPESLRRMGAVYRHDSVQADQFFLDNTDTSGTDGVREKLTVPLTVVASADDPLHSGESTDGWLAWADRVDSVLLPTGGHLFPRTVPDRVAELLSPILTRTG